MNWMAVARPVLSVYLTVALIQAGVGQGNQVLGFATSSGDFAVDGSRVPVTATVFENSVVESTQSAVSVQSGQSVITLGQFTQAVFRENAISLEKGSCDLASGGRFAVEAAGLRVVATAPNSRVVVFRDSAGSITAATRSGGVKVYLLDKPVTDLSPWQAVSFDPDGRSLALGHKSKTHYLLQRSGTRAYLTEESAADAAQVSVIGPDSDFQARFVVTAQPVALPAGFPGSLSLLTVTSKDWAMVPNAGVQVDWLRSSHALGFLGPWVIPIAIVIGIGVAGGYVIWRLVRDVHPRVISVP